MPVNAARDRVSRLDLRDIVVWAHVIYDYVLLPNKPSNYLLLLAWVRVQYLRYVVLFTGRFTAAHKLVDVK